MKKLALSCAIAGALMSLCASVQAAEPIDPIEPVEVKNPALVELGKMLFFEPRLSRSGFISCNSCHNLTEGVQYGRRRQFADFHWRPLGARSDQFTDRIELLRSGRPVLGRPSQNACRTSCRPHRQSA